MYNVELLLALLDNLSDSVCVYNAKGDFVYVNNAVVKIRGISRQQYLKMNVHELYEDRYINVCIFDMICERKREVTALQKYHTPGQAPKVKLVTGFPLFSNTGEIQNVVTILRDFAAYEQMYAEALKANQVICSPNVKASASDEVLIAESPKMKDLLSMARNVAPLDSNVVLYGESGTGKEVIAHYIHEHSSRRAKAMTVVNCAAFTESLLDAELFGYEKGSFTGALSTGKIGLAEAADGGTLFLDEINSFPLNLQSKLLRLIETKTFKPVGAVKNKRVDFRLVTATNVDLEQMVHEGTFRADLFYRLNVVPLRLPPLREHKEDIIPLCHYFIDYFCGRFSLNKRLSKSVLSAAYRYDWPGNVRELRNFVERVMVMTPSNVTLISNIPSGMLGSTTIEAAEIAKSSERAVLDRETIMAALEKYNGYREQTARYLGISRRTLQYKMKDMDIVYTRE